MKVSRPSPTMAVALLALVFSMTGTGIAAKTMITGKQIKDGSITSKDLARGAVKPKHLANAAVTSRSLASASVGSDQIVDDAVTTAELAPDSVTSLEIVDLAVGREDVSSVDLNSVSVDPAANYYETSTSLLRAMSTPNVTTGESAISTESLALSEAITSTWVTCADGSPWTPQQGCPPYARVSAQNVGMNLAQGSCFIMTGRVPFTTLIAKSHHASIFDPTLFHGNWYLTAPVDGLYTVTANGTWAANATGMRHLHIHKTWGPGPFEGQHKIMKIDSATPHQTETTQQSLTIQVPLEAGDSVSVSGGTCGANVALAEAELSMKLAGA